MGFALSLKAERLIKSYSLSPKVTSIPFSLPPLSPVHHPLSPVHPLLPFCPISYFYPPQTQNPRVRLDRSLG